MLEVLVLSVGLYYYCLIKGKQDNVKTETYLPDQAKLVYSSCSFNVTALQAPLLAKVSYSIAF